ncbi:hypothetical protein Ciccas_001259 [Cichlidogyrus casuarinus]|uniref:Uncharacterized protein n=1 Tax=Cichlidogyrus casuarinus TaxID=1844966 RepID=A0ABD2QKL6_9PLAT
MFNGFPVEGGSLLPPKLPPDPVTSRFSRVKEGHIAQSASPGQGECASVNEKEPFRQSGCRMNPVGKRVRLVLIHQEGWRIRRHASCVPRAKWIDYANLIQPGRSNRRKRSVHALPWPITYLALARIVDFIALPGHRCAM